MDSILSVQNQDFTRDEKSLRKFFEPPQKPKVIETDNSLEFGNVERIFHGIIKPQHLIDPSVLFKSGLDEKWWADSLEYYCYLRNVQHLLAEGKIRMKDDMEIHSKGQQFLL